MFHLIVHLRKMFLVLVGCMPCRRVAFSLTRFIHATFNELFTSAVFGVYNIRKPLCRRFPAFLQLYQKLCEGLSLSETFPLRIGKWLFKNVWTQFLLTEYLKDFVKQEFQSHFQVLRKTAF